MKPNMKIICTPIVGTDFIDEHGIRHFNFSLCSRDADGFRARAFVDMRDTQAVRIGITTALEHRKTAILRMARAYQRRSMPQRFYRTA